MLQGFSLWALVGLTLAEWISLGLIVVVVALLALLIFIWLSERTSQAPSPEKQVQKEEPAKVEEAIVSPDDLTRIEGIGPKVSLLLSDKGIRTFEALANTQVSTLQEILREAGLRFIDPSTWPEQAQLAAKGDWDALQALQEELKGGRRM